MIVATAGHIDHGKTALIAALTGADTDRLPEEKRRGLSIDLGFAYQPLAGGEVLGFVDVPGHERFIRNMLAGVAGIDMGLLVVAADDGVMPQTREHAAILDLLGITRCLVAVTKIDRVDTARVAQVTGEVDGLLAATGMHGAPAFPVCAPRDEGVDALREALHARARDTAERSREGLFRLAIDRVFSLKGVGLVVTGTVFSGEALIDEHLMLSPRGAKVRVRGIHAQDRPAHRARAGERCALNLTGKGVSEAVIHRGDWIVDPTLHLPTRRIDARLRVLGTESRRLRHWTPVHIHLGASHTTGRVAVLEAGSVAPGDSALVQIVADDDLHAVFGDRLVLRDQSATRTVAGGAVIDPHSPKRGRARPARLQWLRAMQSQNHHRALEGLLAVCSAGVLVERFQRARNLDDTALEALLEALPGVDVEGGAERRHVGAEHWAALEDAVLAAVGHWHVRHPDRLGPDARELRAAIASKPNEILLGHAVARLAGAGKLARRGVIAYLPGHKARLLEADALRWPKVRQALAPRHSTPRSLNQAADQLGWEPAALREFLVRSTHAGLTLPVTRNRFVPLAPLMGWARTAEKLAREQSDGLFSAAEFRDAVGIGRNFVIELLEFFDRQGLTERLGEKRRVRRPARDVFGDEAGIAAPE